jgi:hypothetical protein
MSIPRKILIALQRRTPNPTIDPIPAAPSLVSVWVMMSATLGGSEPPAMSMIRFANPWPPTSVAIEIASNSNGINEVNA